MKSSVFVIAASLLAAVPAFGGGTPPELRVGVAQYAFDHMGALTNMAGLAAACGMDAIYTGTIGAWGYNGFPAKEKFAKEQREEQIYLKQARAQGIRLAVGYVCATSIVKLDTFDKNWTPEFRARFHTPPAQWRQVDKNGHALPSWYGAPYEPACMNNPDWRAYDEFMVRMQLECGCNAIFFDNPTVHPDGCYCPFCMRKFDKFLAAKPGAARPEKHSLEALRKWAVAHPKDFMDFRSTIAADFIDAMRRYARTIQPNAFMTCNNSLNSPDTLFSQCRAMGYNVDALSGAEDIITIEDMASLAGKRADGRIFEYGPTYKVLHGISHEKPIVACTLADADYYHTLPHLARLSMAEAAAHDASWLLWPGWPDNLRVTMAAAVRPAADFLRRNQKFLNDTQPRCDVLLFLPFRRWLETDHCAAADLASALTRANIQFAVCSEKNLAEHIAKFSPGTRVLLTESASYLKKMEARSMENFEGLGGQVISANEKDWMDKLRKAIGKPSLTLSGPSTVRGVVRDQPGRVVLHLYNLDVQRLSPDADQVHPAKDLGITLRVPFQRVGSVRALTADADARQGSLNFTSESDGGGALVTLTYPNLEVSTILIVEP